MAESPAKKLKDQLDAAMAKDRLKEAAELLVKLEHAESADPKWSHRAGDSMHVEIAMEAMPGEVVHLVEGNLRQVVGVRSLTQVRPQEMRRAA